MHRDAEHPPLEIPQGDVDDAEEPDRELLGPVELPQPVPQPLAAVGALADELLAQNAVDDVRQHAAAPLVVGLADRPVFGRDPEDGGRAGLGRAPETPPPGERRGHWREEDQLDVNSRDLHCG